MPAWARRRTEGSAPYVLHGNSRMMADCQPFLPRNSTRCNHSQSTGGAWAETTEVPATVEFEKRISRLADRCTNHCSTVNLYLCTNMHQTSVKIKIYITQFIVLYKHGTRPF